MEKLIIGFSTPKKFKLLAWLIRRIERTSFSHVYIKIHSKTIDRWLTYQASDLNINFIGDDNFSHKNKIIVEFPIIISLDDKVSILKTAVDLVGKKYGIKQLLGLSLVKLFSVINCKIKNPLSDGSNTYICSELVATILLKIGINFEDLETTTPKDIHNKLREIYG